MCASETRFLVEEHFDISLETFKHLILNVHLKHCCPVKDRGYAFNHFEAAVPKLFSAVNPSSSTVGRNMVVGMAHWEALEASSRSHKAGNSLYWPAEESRSDIWSNWKLCPKTGSCFWARLQDILRPVEASRVDRRSIVT